MEATSSGSRPPWPRSWHLLTRMPPCLDRKGFCKGLDHRFNPLACGTQLGPQRGACGVFPYVQACVVLIEQAL